MAMTFLVAPSIRAARSWCRDNSKNFNNVEVIIRPEDVYGYHLTTLDEVILIEPTNRHTERAFTMLVQRIS